MNASGTRSKSNHSRCACKDIAGQTADKTKEIAGAIADTSKDVASATGEAITDGWITTKVSATFVDETLLEGSHINVDTNNHVVTLKGTVGSDAAKTRAAAIAAVPRASRASSISWSSERRSGIWRG